MGLEKSAVTKVDSGKIPINCALKKQVCLPFTVPDFRDIRTIFPEHIIILLVILVQIRHDMFLNQGEQVWVPG